MFDSFRDEGWNTYYDPLRSAPSHYVLHYIIGYFSIVAAIALSILVISSRGKERWGPALRLLFNLHTAISILFCITGQDWLTANVRTRCIYSPSQSELIQADIGLHIGLKAINITFIADSQTYQNVHDIFYNEEFSLFASNDMESGLHSALERGLPYPILYVVEYFGVDSGGLRWSRLLRLTGHFAYIMLWIALTMWVLSQVLLSFIITRAALLNLGSGVFMIMSVLFYHGIQPETPLVIPFEDGFLRLTYGWCYWLMCASGSMTILYSITLLALHRLLPELVSEVILCDVVHAELYERVKPVHEGVLQINTPLRDRKQKNLEKFQNFYDNPAYIDDECTDRIDRYNNRQCSVKRKSSGMSPSQLESDSSIDVTVAMKRTLSSPAILSEEQPTACANSACKGAEDTDATSSNSWAKSLDHGVQSDPDDEISVPVPSTTVVEINECTRVDCNNKVIEDQVKMSITTGQKGS